MVVPVALIYTQFPVVDLKANAQFGHPANTVDDEGNAQVPDSSVAGASGLAGEGGVVEQVRDWNPCCWK